MKFLCVSCDEPMKLQTVENGGGGSLSVLYGCPKCDHRIAMLTNPLETEMVQSLGVKIGPGERAAATSADPGSTTPAATTGTDAEGESAGGCPFSGMVAQMEQESSADGPRWTAEALSRLENIPDFVRPMAKQGIEHYARTEGLAEIDEEVLERARGRFGM
jgi:hypothetical protein